MKNTFLNLNLNMILPKKLIKEELHFLKIDFHFSFTMQWNYLQICLYWKSNGSKKASGGEASAQTRFIISLQSLGWVKAIIDIALIKNLCI